MLSKVQKNGKVLWNRVFKINNSQWNVAPEDPIINPTNVTNSSMFTDKPYAVLLEVLQLSSTLKHGSTTQIYVTPKYFVFRTRQYILVIDKASGMEVCSYFVKFGTLLSADGNALVI